MRSREDADRLTKILKEEVAKMGVELGDDKSEVMSFDEGFVFLGEEISSKYPELLSLERSWSSGFVSRCSVIRNGNRYSSSFLLASRLVFGLFRCLIWKTYSSTSRTDAIGN